MRQKAKRNKIAMNKVNSFNIGEVIDAQLPKEARPKYNFDPSNRLLARVRRNSSGFLYGELLVAYTFPMTLLSRDALKQEPGNTLLATVYTVRAWYTKDAQPVRRNNIFTAVPMATGTIKILGVVAKEELPRLRLVDAQAEIRDLVPSDIDPAWVACWEAIFAEYEATHPNESVPVQEQTNNNIQKEATNGTPRRQDKRNRFYKRLKHTFNHKKAATFATNVQHA